MYHGPARFIIIIYNNNIVLVVVVVVNWQGSKRRKRFNSTMLAPSLQIRNSNSSSMTTELRNPNDMQILSSASTTSTTQHISSHRNERLVRFYSIPRYLSLYLLGSRPRAIHSTVLCVVAVALAVSLPCSKRLCSDPVYSLIYLWRMKRGHGAI